MLVDIDGFSLKIIDRKVENVSVELYILRVGLLLLLCLEKLYAEENRYEDMKVHTMDGKKPVHNELVKFSQHKKWF